jgi:hypothetical protein
MADDGRKVGPARSAAGVVLLRRYRCDRVLDVGHGEGQAHPRVSLNLDSDGNGAGIIIVGGPAAVDAAEVDPREDKAYWDKYSADAEQFGVGRGDGRLQHTAQDHHRQGVDDTRRRLTILDPPAAALLLHDATYLAGSAALDDIRPLADHRSANTTWDRGAPAKVRVSFCPSVPVVMRSPAGPRWPGAPLMILKPVSKRHYMCA